jgi:hypothetical protein
MFHKQSVDDRVNSAINEGLESQQAARARKTKPGRLGLLGRVFAKLITFRPKKAENSIPISPQGSKLSQNTQEIA